MNKKIGRNDPCPCGSGKKYKQCCQNKKETQPIRTKKLAAKWINAPSSQPPQPIDLMERTFGNAIQENKPFEPAHEE